jgi:hypothetical protein
MDTPKNTPTTEPHVMDKTQWTSYTRNELEELSRNGSYGQRLIADRYLRDWDKDHQ